ncbi:alpha/beta fold hydrolase [Nocardia sp. NPDC050175]|uniref:alpha/beta fold hydrolase n=1 Tax=Nocardia sp. NPDC050175 TaxID=3364317 RepID=UPI0037A0E26A
MFTGFTAFDFDVSGVRIHGVHGGTGPPLLLLHGFPQTHVMWHAVAPRLAEEFTVIASDLRGYGDSGKPPTTPDHAPYTKRAMADDQAQLMTLLGYQRFSVAGHDRGGRCAYRLALDHPGRVERLAVLDVVPTLDALAGMNAQLAHALWRWFFLSQPAPLPENFIATDPETFYFGKHANLFEPSALEIYRRAVADPETVHAMCEDYRAMVDSDVRHDEADRAAGHRITSPLLTLWGKRSHLHHHYNVLDIWRLWADNVHGRALDCGHFLPEESPAETAEELAAFFR